MTDSFSISELAREFAITTRAIRFYEDKQLLKPQRIGNTRVYSRADRTRLKLVLRGKRLGWPLDEVKRVIELYDVHKGMGEKLQLEAMVERLAETREQLLSQQQDLLQTLDEIHELESICRQQLASFRSVLGKVPGKVDSAKLPQSPDSLANADLTTEGVE